VTTTPSKNQIVHGGNEVERGAGRPDCRRSHVKSASSRYGTASAVNGLRRQSGRPAPRSTSLPPWTIWLLLGVVVTFAVLRNLPGWAWLSPA